MTSTKYIGMDVHTESISIAVRNSLGKVVIESVIETKASTILQFIDGLRGDVRVTFEEGTWATWLYDLLKPHVTEVLVCNTRNNAVRNGSKSDRIDARKLSEMLYMNNVKSVHHGEHGLRILKALYRSWAIPCTGNEVCAALPCGMARQDQRSRRPTTRRTLLPAVGCLATAASGSTAGFVGGGQGAQAVEATTPHSVDRPDPGRHFDRSDADASSLPHQAATVELQRAGIRHA